MSNNYIWFEHNNMLQCTSFKAAYQLCRKMYKHNFYCENETVMGNTRIIQLHKCSTDIIIYVSDKVYDMFNHETISYKDYINSIKGGKQ